MATWSDDNSLITLLQRSVQASFILALLYFLGFCYSAVRWLRPCANVCRWSMERLFMGSIVLALFIRACSFGTLTLLTLLNINPLQARARSQPLTSDQRFYDHTLTVLYNAGDWVAISNYLFLIVVWAEHMQKARQHLRAQTAVRQEYMIACIVINSTVYLLQTGLYIAAVVSSAHSELIFKCIYIAVATLNLALPLLVVGISCAYALLLSGFPFRSRKARVRWQRLNQLLLLMTIARLIWAASAILSLQSTILDAALSAPDWVFSIIIAAQFIIFELLPFLACLNSSILDMFGVARVALLVPTHAARPWSTDLAFMGDMHVPLMLHGDGNSASPFDTPAAFTEASGLEGTPTSSSVLGSTYATVSEDMTPSYMQPSPIPIARGASAGALLSAAPSAAGTNVLSSQPLNGSASSRAQPTGVNLGRTPSFSSADGVLPGSLNTGSRGGELPSSSLRSASELSPVAMQHPRNRRAIPAIF